MKDTKIKHILFITENISSEDFDKYSVFKSSDNIIYIKDSLDEKTLKYLFNHYSMKHKTYIVTDRIYKALLIKLFHLGIDSVIEKEQVVK